jgi:nucleotide-binding universal stress UspA family protein
MKSTITPSKQRTRKASASVAIQPSQRKIKALKIRNLLVTTDFSAASVQALEAARPLLNIFNADLHLVFVAPPDHAFWNLVDIPMVLPDPEVARSARRRLHETAIRYFVPLRPKNIHVLKGRPFEQICQLAHDLNLDMIVTSTRGNTGLRHLTLGSTAERVVRYSPCPVLVVRPRNRFKKILVPIDFSDCSKHALNYAKALAAQFGSKLILLNSVALQYYFASDEYARYDFPDLTRRAEATAKKQLRDLVRQSDFNGLKVEIALEVGHAGQQICEQAADLEVDLIVTSTHGRTGFKHIMLGSTAEYVVRHAPCSVLVVPSHERFGITSTVKHL